MFSKCLTCGYTAEPQDIFCVVCPSTIVNGRREFNRMTRMVGDK
jgi:uncharacterized OB-fold protein